jgi:lipopolysaccharide transport system ATP-binding protein
MSDVVIAVDHLAKRYLIGAAQERYVALRDVLSGQFKRIARRVARRKAAHNPKTQEFWALRDVSFEVRRGECVGIIGRNGAGKSTLLKLLSRITEPTAGEIRLRGRVGSLLEVGTGFHQELTGRENISLNGAILGMGRKEIARKFDEIVAFAEVEKFLDTPVKYYSSGMYMRLAFAVAAHLEPEILIVDEVLAVGDSQFQQKCLGKMGEISRGGRTVLFVSHNMAAVQSLCSRAVMLVRGQVAKVGAAADTVTAYLAGVQRLDGRFNTSGRNQPPGAAEIVDAWMERNGAPVDSFLHGDGADVVIEIELREATSSLAVELILRQQDGLAVAFCPSGLAKDWHINAAAGRARVRCRLPRLNLARGPYTLDLILAVSGVGFVDYVESGLGFAVESAAVGPRNWGFEQGRGQGCFLWDVAFEMDGAAGARATGPTSGPSQA